MTNLEAKEKLYMEWQKLLDYSLDYAGISEAYKMAFKALEQEPCEDAISRQAVIDALTKTSGIRGDALKALYDLPPVNPQPKTGHWKKWEYGTHRCSICDKFIGRERYPYCPYCGAKMVEPQKSEVEE